MLAWGEWHTIRRCRYGMSALETFVRIRQYKDRAAEFFELAAQPFHDEVRARYLAIADHYMALADAVLRSDQLVRKQRLDLMRAEREKSKRSHAAPDAGVKLDHPAAPRPPGPAKLRLVQNAKPPARLGSSGPAQMAAQSNFPTIKLAR
jgi:hypothetical protein